MAKKKSPSPKSKKLRFAALIRVSTEKQEKRGESLRVQEKQINQAVESLDGEIKRTYAGQEHATAGWERKQLDKLLADAAKSDKPFDAIIVCDPSRWSRDNVTNETGLDTLRENDIRFFVLGMEFKLFDPMHRFILSSQATLNKLTAELRTQKATLSCISLAERGIITNNKPPFGRTFDRKTEKWGIDPDKHAMVKDVAKRYLAGVSMGTLAEEYGVNHSHLHKVMTKRCGVTHTVTFNPPGLKINETIEMQVPRLLPEKTIKAILRKAEENRTYRHGQFRKNGERCPYLLSGMVFCAECGYSMYGQTQPATGRRYYRHSQKDGSKDCPLRPRPYVPLEELEKAVFERLFETFGNPQGVREAIDAAVPNKEKMAEYTKQKERVEADLAKIEQARDRILDLGDSGKISRAKEHQRLDRLNEKESKLQDELDQLTSAMSDMPSKSEVDRIVEATYGQNKLFFRASKKIGKRRYVATKRNRSHPVGFVFSQIGKSATPCA